MVKLFVNQSNSCTDLQDGKSWNTAFTDLQLALDVIADI